MTDDTKNSRPRPYRTAHYEVHLPVFKQGDDLADHLEDQKKVGGSVADAFEALARRYEAAAAHCRRIVGLAREVPDLEANADCHYVGITGPWERLDPLVEEGLLARDFAEDEELDGLEVETEGAVEELLGVLERGAAPAGARAAEGEEDALASLLAAHDPRWKGVQSGWVRHVLRRMVAAGRLEVTPAGSYRLVEDEG